MENCRVIQMQVIHLSQGVDPPYCPFHNRAVQIGQHPFFHSFLCYVHFPDTVTCRPVVFSDHETITKTTVVARQSTHATIYGLLGNVSSKRSAPRYYLQDSSCSQSVYEELVSELESQQLRPGTIQESRGRGTSTVWKPIPSNAVKTVTESTSVAVICNMQSVIVLRSPKFQTLSIVIPYT